MEQMRGWARVAGLVGIISLAVNAAPAAAFHGWGGKGHDKEQRVEKRVERMTKALGLSGEQAGQLRTILETQRSEMEQAWAASHEKAQQQITALLTPEQQEKYAKLKEHRQERKDRKQSKRKGEGKEKAQEAGTPQ